LREVYQWAETLSTQMKLHWAEAFLEEHFSADVTTFR
jgi:hypothetical protein